MSNQEMFSEEIKSGEIYKKHNDLNWELSAAYSKWEVLQLKLEGIDD